MTTEAWGIGVPSWLGTDGIASLASLAEHRGYASFWFNCVAPDADPALMLQAALEATDRITIGVGVVPLDVYPVEDLARDLVARGCDIPRVIVGVGSGATRAGSLERVQQGLSTLRAAVPQVELSVGTGSERMTRVAREHAESVLLSMTPLSRVETITGWLAGPAEPRTGRGFTVDRYHRVAVGADAVDHLTKEMVAYRMWPRDGSRPAPAQLLGSVVTAADRAVVEIGLALAVWPVGWRHVLRPLPANPRDLGETRDLFEVLTPIGC